MRPRFLALAFWLRFPLQKALLALLLRMHRLDACLYEITRRTREGFHFFRAMHPVLFVGVRLGESLACLQRHHAMHLRLFQAVSPHPATWPIVCCSPSSPHSSHSAGRRQHPPLTLLQQASSFRRMLRSIVQPLAS